MLPIDRRGMLLTMTAFAAAACTSAPPAPKFPTLSYSHLSPFRFEASSMEVVNAYRAPMAPPNVEHLMPLSPADAATRWANDRLVAAGGTNRLVFTIESAAVVESPLEKESGVRGMFITDQDVRYNAAILVKLQVFAPDGREAGVVTAEAFRDRTVPEGLTMNEREKILFDLTESLTADLNRELDRAIPQYLSQYLA